MPWFEVETTSHVMIDGVPDEPSARAFATANAPAEGVLRDTHRPRDAWVISKNLLGVVGASDGPCATARDGLSQAQGDERHAVRLSMHRTGADLDGSRKVIESNVAMGW